MRDDEPRPVWMSLPSVVLFEKALFEKVPELFSESSGRAEFVRF
jgi:hypothetical protein